MTEIPLTPPTPARFESCEFIAHLKELRTISKGKVVVLEVPFDRMDLVTPLDRAVGVPLHIRVEVWQPLKVVDGE